MTKRIYPSVMQTVAEEHKPTAKEQSSVETARVQNLDPNLCPICGADMLTRETNGILVKTCLQHNIVMPFKNE